jgi:hypothetical protein
MLKGMKLWFSKFYKTQINHMATTQNERPISGFDFIK